MGLCVRCGALLAAGAAFCPGCGAAQRSSSGGDDAAAAAGSGLEEHVVCLLCYLVPFVGSIIFYAIDKRPFVRFHVVQSTMFFLCAYLLYQVLGFVPGFFPGAWDPLAFSYYSRIIFGAYWSVMIGFWSLSMRKAYRHERFKLPFLGNFAENIAGK